MARDGHRKYPVNTLVMHHSVGPEFVNASEQEVADWFSRIGKERGYQGIARSNHIDPRTKKETFAMAQYALHKYTKDKNKYGWRIVELMAEPIHNVAWHAGNWEVNQRSLGVETCGDFRNQELPDKACMLVADYFRGVDKELVAAGYKDGLYVIGHKDIVATACPANIAKKLPTIIDMINNPKKWNDKLWPPKKEEPKPKPAPEPEPSKEDLLKAQIGDLKAEISRLHDQMESMASEHSKESREWREYKDVVDRQIETLDSQLSECRKDCFEQQEAHEMEREGWHAAEDGYTKTITRLDRELQEAEKHLQTALKNAKDPARWSAWEMIFEGVRRLFTKEETNV